ncbi:hypothetical protein KGA66_26250 [Actinocrinis puniceicyclus]|uniref:Molecular chaperone Hsp90 n=1 Tax=Actinocrinis puniceicyclus TaxID=977794 RepID=A0A8J7WQE3_9ACTN|nr:hypothetical protein [Actinocrinis puniceicyclus]MBS2966568.1 hypothetical protein [Actinocrinis puniceicyclus]
MTDRFDTAAIRSRVLDAWAAAPVRFREDANLEEDLVVGAYRDRVVIELAQNAADAATRAGRAGRLRLSLRRPPAGPAELVAANTGSALDAAGVVGLATLRASSKRDEWDGGGAAGDPVGGAGGTVGRFGVGFAAVLAVSDEPVVLSRQGSVRFSAAHARAAVEDVAVRSPELGRELRRREGRIPVLRLPFPAEGVPPEGYDTAVVLPLRDSAAEQLARRLLGEIDDALLLALPRLAEIVVEDGDTTRTLTSRSGGEHEWVVTDGSRTTRWRLSRAHGALDPLLLANRPVEERARPYWSVTWAVPLDAEADAGGAGAREAVFPGGGFEAAAAAAVAAAAEPLRPRTAPVVHAPTPTDEPLGLPALLIGSFPLDPTRRHVAPGDLADFLLDQAAAAYAQLVAQWPRRDPGLLRLVPGPVAEGALDGALRERIVRLLPRTACLPAADGGREPLRPQDAAVIVPCDEALVAAVADVVPGLLPAGWERDTVALGALRVRRLELSALVEILAALRREPSWWGRLYAALEGVAGYDPGAREALGALPVPLADGRMVRGAAGALLFGGGPGAAAFGGGGLEQLRWDALRPLGLRVVHPAALGPGAYGLLERLGARPAQPRAVLADPAVRGALAAARDRLPQADPQEGEDPAALAEAVLALVRAAAPRPGERFGLGDLLLPDERGVYTPARELLLPGSPLAGVVEPGAFGCVDAQWVRRWGGETLRAVGVLDTFTVVRAADVLFDPDGIDAAPGGEGSLFELDGFEQWLDQVRELLPAGARDAPPVTPELVAVRDLDLVARERWPAALDLLAGPGLRAAVTEPMRVLTGDGRSLRLPSYTSWWLGRHPVLDGRCPADLAIGGGLLSGLYEQIPGPGDDPQDRKQYPDASRLPREMLEGLGVRAGLGALLDSPGGADELLGRLADARFEVGARQLVELYDALAQVPQERVDPPRVLRALVDGRPQLVDAADVAVVEAPDLLALLEGVPCLAVAARNAERLADLLDVSLAGELVQGRVTSEGECQPVPGVVLELLPGAPESYFEHEELILDGEVESDWRVVDGQVHASTFDGLARALAWAAGRWERRHLIAAVLAEPERAGQLAAETYFE